MEGNFKKWINKINCKLNKGGYTGTAQDLKDEIDNIQVGASNLVPYTNANKDVNIGAYYFETSQGFKKTGGTANQYLMADGSVSTITNNVTGTGTTNYLSKFTASGTIGNSIIYDNGTNVGIGTNTPNSTDRVHVFSSTTKSSIRLQSTHSASSAEINFQSVGGSGQFELDYSGNMVFRTSQSSLFFDNFSTTGAINFRTGGANTRMTIDKDGEIFTPSGKIKPQRTITITGNITLSEMHNGAILHVTNTCNITIPTGLDANFQCVVYAKGSIIVTFVNGGVTLNSPSGLLLKTDKMASLFANASNTFNLLGELATS